MMRPTRNQTECLQDGPAKRLHRQFMMRPTRKFKDCLPGFFQYLDVAEISKRPYATEPYLEAWRDYQQCLARNDWDD